MLVLSARKTVLLGYEARLLMILRLSDIRTGIYVLKPYVDSQRKVEQLLPTVPAMNPMVCIYIHFIYSIT